VIFVGGFRKFETNSTKGLVEIVGLNVGLDVGVLNTKCSQTSDYGVGDHFYDPYFVYLRHRKQQTKERRQNASFSVLAASLSSSYQP
jgi:hypothetical protein